MILKQTMIGGSVASTLLAITGSAAAPGFALSGQSGSGMGNACAGDHNSTTPAGSVIIRVETIAHYLEKYSGRIIGNKCACYLKEFPLIQVRRKNFKFQVELEMNNRLRRIHERRAP